MFYSIWFRFWVCVRVCDLFSSWFFFFFKQKTAYEMRISDWSSDVCPSGLITTIGVSAKNAILIVEFAEEKMREGLPPARAALEAGKLRLRPILMTSFAFVFGVLPLALAKGAGAGDRKSTRLNSSH